MAIKGIDVSKWQGTIDWQKVKSAGVDFAVVKLGNGLSNGNLSVDPYFTKNFKGALSVGLRVGVYVFMYGTSVSAAKLVAENTVATLSTSKNLLSLPVFFDLEWDDTAATGRANCTAMAVAWRDVIAKAGFVPGLYTNPNWLKNYISCPDNCKLWLAHYAKTPYCSSYIWQYTMAGRVDGINTDVDIDWGYFEIADEAPTVSIAYNPQDDLEYLAKAGIIDSPDIWLKVLSGEITASVQNHIIPLIAKFRNAVEDKDNILDELQDIIANHDD